jgi:hypothetical protein
MVPVNHCCAAPPPPRSIPRSGTSAGASHTECDAVRTLGFIPAHALLIRKKRNVHDIILALGEARPVEPQCARSRAAPQPIRCPRFREPMAQKQRTRVCAKTRPLVSGCAPADRCRSPIKWWQAINRCGVKAAVIGFHFIAGSRMRARSERSARSPRASVYPPLDSGLGHEFTMRFLL